ncbi:putative leucine-rich repeat domain, L domain-containing protein [Medicago truncatula]|uniref:Putative leucine-rich repeat domain, L domain-containing protein n=1 Tax=Medicago truncatula TaxID=3880 RepID=A0A396IJ30_MEDTR|nr:putative leucine-rich repeat domain, L domain-containing protein [Medicago truncatula]
MLQSIVQWTHIFLIQIRIQHCSDRSLTLVAQRCSNLEILSIRSSLRITDSSISMIAFGCPNLRELDIGYCYMITQESLVVIGRNCPNLKRSQEKSASSNPTRRCCSSSFAKCFSARWRF